MLQKFENVFLSILRIATILAAGMLLIIIAITGIDSLKLLKPDPVHTSAPVKISSQALVESLTAKPTANINTGKSPQANKRTPATDLNKEINEKSAKLISAFVARTSGNTVTLDQDMLANLLHKRAKGYPDKETASAFAIGISEAIGTALGHPEVERLARESDPIELVDKILESYTSMFDKELMDSEAKLAKLQAGHLADRESSIQSLYMTGGTFMTFLLIVFLSIFIRVERSLRNLDRIK